MSKSFLFTGAVGMALLCAVATAGPCGKGGGRGRVSRAQPVHRATVVHPHVVQGTVVHQSAPQEVVTGVVTHAPAGSVDGERIISERVVSSPAVPAAAPPAKDIVDTAVGAGSFKTLAAALGAADLVSTLKGEGPFTVFAPTDDAFAKLPPGTVESLLEPQNIDKLKSILLLHVVPGKVLAKDVVGLTEATTAGGGKLAVSTDGGVSLSTPSGKANVVKTDVEAKNGVIHVIDSVLLP